jgi:hypothetical protein
MPRRLTRTDVNFCLDVALLALFLTLSTCSVIVEFVFPSGSQTEGWLLWGQSYNAWCRFRFSILAVMAGAIVLHVMLHWSWVCGVAASRLGNKKAGSATAKDDPSRTLWGVGLLILIVNVIGVIVAAAALTIHAPPAGS